MWSLSEKDMQISWQNCSNNWSTTKNTTATVLRKKETKWVLKICTAFIHGPNDKIREEHQWDRDIPIGTGFSSLKRNKKHPTRSEIRLFVKIIQ